MIDYRLELKKILHQKEPIESYLSTQKTFKLLNEKDLANLFIDVIYLQNIIQMIIDEHWIQSQKSETEIFFERFIKNFLDTELRPLLYLHAYFQKTNIESLRSSLPALKQVERSLLELVKFQGSDFKITFLQISLKKMSDLYELEHQLISSAEKQIHQAKLSLDRTFDILDQIFGLDYLLNEVFLEEPKERVFANSNIGVQSSYATTLLAIRYLNLKKGSKFIDLGSGYGRIGLVLGLTRPDINFKGYEFVKERVAIANKASLQLKLDHHVQFLEQDLAGKNFQIPLADTYYIFDSFTDASYKIIMDQLQALTLQQKITVVTKGNAKLWMNNEFWSDPQEFYEGNLCIFRSNTRPRSA